MDENDLIVKTGMLITAIRSLANTRVGSDLNTIVNGGMCLIAAGISTLKQALEDPEVRGVDWDTPRVLIPWELDIGDWLWAPASGVGAGQHIEKRQLERLLQEHLERKEATFFLAGISGNVGLFRGKTEFYLCCSEQQRAEIKQLSPEEQATRVRGLVEPEPFGFSFPLHAARQRESPEELRAAVEVQFRPLVADLVARTIYFPICIGMLFYGYNPASLGKTARAAVWETAITEARTLIERSGRSILARHLEGVARAEVKITESVPYRHVEAYEDLVKSFGAWQASHLRRTGRLAAVEGTLRIDEIKADLTSKQRNDYSRHDYVRYERVRIPGGTPIKRSNQIEIGGNSVGVGDASLKLLLRLAVELKRNKGGWVKVGDLVDEGVISADGKYQAFERLRKALQLGLPDGAAKDLIQGSGSEKFRLSVHPDFVEYRKSKLMDHPERDIRMLARKLPRSRKPKK